MSMAGEQLQLCPFGIEARFCQYQKVRTKDLLSAMQGDLVFICLLSKKEDCPIMKDLFKEVNNDTLAS